MTAGGKTVGAGVIAPWVGCGLRLSRRLAGAVIGSRCLTSVCNYLERSRCLHSVVTSRGSFHRAPRRLQEVGEIFMAPDC